jgi:hypothetical protein
VLVDRARKGCVEREEAVGWGSLCRGQPQESKTERQFIWETERQFKRESERQFKRESERQFTWETERQFIWETERQFRFRCKGREVTTECVLKPLG